jgi:hypothetical protein
MMDKPSYILDVEKTEGILSVMEIPYSVDKKYEDILKKTPVVIVIHYLKIRTK